MPGETTIEEMKVLILEDQVKLGQSLKRGLGEQGWTVEWVQTAAAAQEAMGETPYDVVVLDLMLPDRDGLEVLREWRQYSINVPVIILSARNSLRDRIKGLEDGADDYLSKPFSMEELVARIRVVKRRQTNQIEIVLQHRDIVLNPANHTVTLRGRPVDMTAREFSLLEIFLQNTGRLLTRSLLIEKVWDVDYDVDSNLLDVYMSRLRGKLESGAGKPYFETVRGMGYKML